MAQALLCPLPWNIPPSHILEGPSAPILGRSDFTSGKTPIP